MVGPVWDQLSTVVFEFLFLDTLKARLSRRVGVVRVLGSFGQGGTTRCHRRVLGCLWSGGDLG